MGDLSDFQRGQIVGALLAGASVTKMATLLGLSRAEVSRVMTASTNHWKTSSAKRNSGREQKRSERDRFRLKRILPINSRTTATKVTAELNIHLKHPLTTVSIVLISSVCLLVKKQAIMFDYKQEQNTAY